MKAEDVQRTVDQAIEKAVLGKHKRPKLPSDNGSCYIASELKDYLQANQIMHLHDRLLHPQTQSKIERYHRSMKNVVKLDNYNCPEELKAALEQFAHYYYNQRYHESPDNVTPAEVYWGRKEQILKQRKRIKQQTLLKLRSMSLIKKLVNT